MVDCAVARIGSYQPVVAYYGRLVCFLIERVVVLSLADNAQALNGANINSLAHVESLGKTTVICVKKSEDVLSRPLIGLIHFYPIFLQLDRIDHKSNTV